MNGSALGAREPVHECRAGAVDVGVGIVVCHRGSIRQEAIHIAHGQNGIGVGVAVRTRAAKLGVKRGGAEIALALGRGGYPGRNRLLISLKDLVVILEPCKEEQLVPVVIEACERKRQRTAEISAGIKVLLVRAGLAEVIVVPVVGVQNRVASYQITLAVIRSAARFRRRTDERRTFRVFGAIGRVGGLDVLHHLDVHLLHRTRIGGDVGQRNAVTDDGDAGRTGAIGDISRCGAAQSNYRVVVSRTIEKTLIAGRHCISGQHLHQLAGVATDDGEVVQIF